MTRSKSKKKQNTQNGNQAQKPSVAIECTENIAMLHFLHSVPDQPFMNPIVNIKTNGAGYSLPFDQEQSLVATLAFLAQIEDDPDHIPAVCLQEVLNSGSLEVLLAINRKADSAKWQKYASKIAEGFEGIAAILRNVDDCSRNIEQKLFTLIVQLCRSRILCRLRFTRKWRDSPDKKRTTIKDGLESVVGYLRENQSKSTKMFLDRARKVLKLADSWENHQTEPPLEALVDGINLLRQTNQYKEILKSVPKTVVDVNHVLNMTLKVSRYRECATILSRAARNFPSVRDMRVNLVELPNEVFSRPAVNSNYRPNMHSTISRCQNINHTLKDVNQICNLLQVSVEKAGAQYSEQVKESLANAKVHAEIQLVYYCQVMPKGTLPPRVICSSKSACWLCNAFIRFHGKFYMPRCHGKLYPGWRLPNLPGAWSNDIAKRFTLRLSGLLTESLKTLYIRKARTRYPDPIESDLSTVKGSSVLSLNSNCLGGFSGEKGSEQLSAVVHSISKATEWTTAASPVETILEEEIPAEDVVPNINASSENHASVSLVSTVGPGPPTQAKQPDFVVHDDLKSPEPTTTANQDARIPEVEMPNTDAIYGSHTSSKGHTSSSLIPTAISDITAHACVSSSDAPQESQEEARHYDISLGEVSPVYTSGPLKLQFEYVSGTQKRGNPRTQLSCTAEWLSPKEAAQLKLEGVMAIDAESLTGDEISHSTDTSNNVYVRLGEAVLRITMRPW